MRSIQHDIKETIAKADEYIAFFATNTEKCLEKRIRINQAQYVIASKKGMNEMCELLALREHILIIALHHKEDNKIPDVLSEFEITLAEIDREERRRAATEALLKPKPIVPSRMDEHEHDDTDKNPDAEQLRLF